MLSLWGGGGEVGRVGLGGGALSMAEYKSLDFLQTDSIQEAQARGKSQLRCGQCWEQRAVFLTEPLNQHTSRV